MQKTKIQALKKTRTIDFGNEEINNFWLKKNDKLDYQKSEDLHNIISVLQDVQDSIICVQTGELNHSEVITAIFNASKKRNRIYILTNKKDTSLKQFEGACLIRYGIENIGSFILIKPNSSSAKGIIYTAAFVENSLANSDNIVLDLDNEQIKTLFRFFSDNFWNKAQFEIIENFDNPKEIGEPPLDFLPNIKDFCDADFVRIEISKIDKKPIISVPNLYSNDLLDFTDFDDSIILTSLKNNDTELLSSLAIKNHIFANQRNTSRLIIVTKNNSWLIPKTNISTDDNFYALKLNDNQIDNLDDLINDRIDNAEFQFHLSKTRKDLDNEKHYLLDNIDTEIEIKSKKEKDLGNILLTELLSKEEFEQQEPEFMDDNTSVEIKYNWQINPFYTPKNAIKAKLYQDWEQYQNEYNILVEKIENTINESENKKIGERLKRWFIGKSQTISKQQEKLDNLKLEKLAVLEISQRQEIIKKINELANNVSSNLTEINTEIEKSEIETEIEAFKLEKEEKENEFEVFIEEQEKILKEKEEKKDEKLTVFLEKYKIQKEELSKFISELQRKKNKKKEKIAEDQEKLNEFHEIEGFNFRKKLEDDKQKLEKEIKNIKNRIINKEIEFEKVGKEQKINNNSSLNSVFGKEQNYKKITQNKEFSIPENIGYLPQIGELQEVGKQKFLEIEFWEDYELAKKETERLNAKLSAKK